MSQDEDYSSVTPIEDSFVGEYMHPKGPISKDFEIERVHSQRGDQRIFSNDDYDGLKSNAEQSMDDLGTINDHFEMLKKLLDDILMSLNTIEDFGHDDSFSDDLDGDLFEYSGSSH